MPETRSCTFCGTWMITPKMRRRCRFCRTLGCYRCITRKPVNHCPDCRDAIARGEDPTKKDTEPDE